MSTQTYDVVIVGGGTAGSVIAARLAERTDLEIAVLEAGPTDEDRPEVLHVANWMELLGGELDYDYAIEEQERGNSHIRASRARVLGGCSSHNSCIAFQAPDRDLREWVDLGAKGWGPAEMARHYADVREQVGMAVQDVRNPVFDDLLAACEAVDLPTARFNSEAWLRSFPPSAGRFELNVRDGVRMSSSVAYLHPTIDLPGTLDVLTGTRVHRVIVDDEGRATGVETERGTIEARREVVLCAGAVDTPKLLQLSGIGPRDVLDRAGVDTRLDLPVGEHLLDHPEGVVVFEAHDTLPRASTQGWEMGIFAVTQEGETHPDLMFHLGLEPFDEHTTREGYGTAEQGISLTPNVARARSEGWVRIASSDPQDRPRIDFRYFTDPEGYDERVMVEGVRLARRIAAQEPLARWLEGEVAPGPGVQSDEELSAYVRSTANTVYHPAGTCRMGDPDDDTTVVDPELRVLGVEGLRVADASVFPSMTSVNPAITVMAIGERCAELLSA